MEIDLLNVLDSSTGRSTILKRPRLKQRKFVCLCLILVLNEMFPPYPVLMNQEGYFLYVYIEIKVLFYN